MSFTAREKEAWLSEKVPELRGATYHSVGMTTITQDILIRNLQDFKGDVFAEFLLPALDEALLSDLSDEELQKLLEDPKKIANILSISCIVTVPTKLYADKEILHRAFDAGLHQIWELKSNGLSSVTPKIQVQESTRFNPKLPRALIMIIVQYTRIEAMRMWANKAKLRTEFVIPDIDPSLRSTDPLTRFAGVTTKEAQVDRLNQVCEDAEKSPYPHHAQLLEAWKVFFTTTSAPGRGSFQKEESS